MPQNHFDEDLEMSVKELMRNSRIDYSHVEVSVDAGNVHFTGTLEDEEEKVHLSEMVSMIQGAGSVINDVTLKH